MAIWAANGLDSIRLWFGFVAFLAGCWWLGDEEGSGSGELRDWHGISRLASLRTRRRGSSCERGRGCLGLTNEWMRHWHGNRDQRQEWRIERGVGVESCDSEATRGGTRCMLTGMEQVAEGPWWVWPLICGGHF